MEDHGWKKVTYVKKNKKSQKAPAGKSKDSGVDEVEAPGNLFESLEKDTVEKGRKIDVNGEVGYDLEKGKKRVEKKEKVKKPKMPKVSIADAAAKIDAGDLAAFLNDVGASYESKQDIQLMRFADYFGRAFSAVNAAQFPYLKMFREEPVAKNADIPISHISETVYKTSVDWISQKSYEALGSFVLWVLESIMSDLLTQQSGSKGSKKASQQASSKSQVAMFLVISMVLRRKPDVLINICSTLTENSKYQGQDKLLVIVWMIVQASQGDLAVGLYLWGHHTLPLLRGKQFSNPQLRDLVLQLAERILSVPKSRSILVNGAVRKGERLLPPSELDLLLRLSFPPSSTRAKSTERFAAIYPTLKAVALAGSPGSKAMKQVSQQMMVISLRAASEGIPELSKEASSISIWCFSASPDSFKHWDKLYMDNIEASVAILKKLNGDWKKLSAKQICTDPLVETLKSFRKKNEKALNGGVDVAAEAVFKEADKYCKLLLGRLSTGYGCLIFMALFVLALAVLVKTFLFQMETLYSY
ncbi:hypothetical protein LIER_23325 [Lithospermum erythrorhizon]|uniref:Transmembrane protein n=1 Tax=Lithospermum erythrorhizon TaxID=34254 RepID=A0AAV3R2P3_LITER